MFTLNRKDLDFDWFSGTGAGGQHRNKHMNCLRLRHIPTGIRVTAQNARDRVTNERDAMEKLTTRVKSFLHPEAVKERFKAKETIRSYREPDNMVKDLASDEVFSYKKVVLDADADTVGEMITARRNAVLER